MFQLESTTNRTAYRFSSHVGISAKHISNGDGERGHGLYVVHPGKEYRETERDRVLREFKLPLSHVIVGLKYLSYPMHVSEDCLLSTSSRTLLPPGLTITLPGVPFLTSACDVTIRQPILSRNLVVRSLYNCELTDSDG
jgi:hypothetical protein